MKVFARGIEFFAFQGMSEAERTVGHRFLLDLEAEVAHESAASDELSNTVDYGEMARVAIELCNAVRDRTVEAAIERIGKGLLDRFPLMSVVQVRLAKLQPALPIIVGSVGVEKIFYRLN